MCLDGGYSAGVATTMHDTAWLFGGASRIEYGYMRVVEHADALFSFNTARQTWSRKRGAANLAARRNFAHVELPGNSGVPPTLLLHGGWLGSAPSSSTSEEGEKVRGGVRQHQQCNCATFCFW